MAVLNRIPDRAQLRAVLMIREGIGWAVGAGGIVAGRIEDHRSGHLGEREAGDAAVALADRLDLLVVRSERPSP